MLRHMKKWRMTNKYIRYNFSYPDMNPHHHSLVPWDYYFRCPVAAAAVVAYQHVVAEGAIDQDSSSEYPNYAKQEVGVTTCHSLYIHPSSAMHLWRIEYLQALTRKSAAAAVPIMHYSAEKNVERLASDGEVMHACIFHHLLLQSWTMLALLFCPLRGGCCFCYGDESSWQCSGAAEDEQEVETDVWGEMFRCGAREEE